MDNEHKNDLDSFYYEEGGNVSINYNIGEKVPIFLRETVETINGIYQNYPEIEIVGVIICKNDFNSETNTSLYSEHIYYKVGHKLSCDLDVNELPESVTHDEYIVFHTHPVNVINEYNVPDLPPSSQDIIVLFDYMYVNFLHQTIGLSKINHCIPKCDMVLSPKGIYILEYTRDLSVYTQLQNRYRQCIVDTPERDFHSLMKVYLKKLIGDVIDRFYDSRISMQEFVDIIMDIVHIKITFYPINKK